MSTRLDIGSSNDRSAYTDPTDFKFVIMMDEAFARKVQRVVSEGIRRGLSAPWTAPGYGLMSGNGGAARGLSFDDTTITVNADGTFAWSASPEGSTDRRKERVASVSEQINDWFDASDNYKERVR